MASVTQMMVRAKQTNARRDQGERAAGFAAPTDCDDSELARTVITALHAGIDARDWECVAEGLAMLGDRYHFRPWEST